MFWILWLLAIGSVGRICVDAQTQRVAPGVPPQQYQQPQMHQQVPHQQMHGQMPQQQMHGQVPHQQQQYQQQQQQYQQVPVQQQQQQHQPPMQQQQPQQHHQQQMNHQQQGHHHDHNQNPQQLLKPVNMAHEGQHIAEHLDVPMDVSKMSEQELQYHYFKMHDADNNNKLDGCELIKSLIHWHAEQGNQAPGATGTTAEPNAGEKLFSDEELSSLIDPILSMDDTNRDGYIDYPEFIQAQKKAATSGTPTN